MCFKEYMFVCVKKKALQYLIDAQTGEIGISLPLAVRSGHSLKHMIFGGGVNLIICNYDAKYMFSVHALDI